MISDVLMDATSQIEDYLTDMPTVYVGKCRHRIDCLLRQMDSLCSSLNDPTHRWSALDMSEAATQLGIQRVRCELEAKRRTVEELGRDVGAKWAVAKGKAEELQRLDAFDAHTVLFNDLNNAYSAREKMYFWMRPTEEGDRTAAATFWDGLNAPKVANDIDWLLGFTTGASEVLQAANA